MTGLEISLASVGGLLTGICLGAAVLYLARIPPSIERGGFLVPTRPVGALSLLVGAMTFLAWLYVPWLVSLIAPGVPGLGYSWLSYLLSSAVGVGLVELAFRGGRRGSLHAYPGPDMLTAALMGGADKQPGPAPADT